MQSFLTSDVAGVYLPMALLVGTQLLYDSMDPMAIGSSVIALGLITQRLFVREAMYG